MGTKGAKHTEPTKKAAESLLADLEPLGDVTAKRMFGGYGFFSEGVMFALVDPNGTAFLRVNEANEALFEGAERHGRMPYASIPDEIRDDPDALIRCATESVEAAQAAKK